MSEAEATLKTTAAEATLKTTAAEATLKTTTGATDFDCHWKIWRFG
jgi:hypothetical protein